MDSDPQLLRLSLKPQLFGSALKAAERQEVFTALFVAS